MKPCCRISATVIVLGVASSIGAVPGMAGEPRVKGKAPRTTEVESEKKTTDSSSSNVAVEEPAKTARPPVVNPVLESMRSALGRAVAVNDPARRGPRLLKADQLLEKSLAANKGNPQLMLDLLDARIDAAMFMGDEASAKRLVQRQSAVARSQLDTAGFGHWLPQQVHRFRKREHFDLAIYQLGEAEKADAGTLAAAQRALLIGDILVQKVYPAGPFDEAIRQFEKVARTYRTVSSDLADDARLRQAKYMWINGAEADAEALFAELGKTANESVGETARHFVMINEISLRSLQKGAAHARARIQKTVGAPDDAKD